MAEGLTLKQQAFVDAYLDCLNASEAARRAGYSEKTARQQGQRLLTNVDIAAAVQAGFKVRAMPEDEVIARLSMQASADVRELYNFDEEGNVSGLRLHRDAPLHLIRSITPTRYGNKIEVHDQQAALVHLGKFHGVFVERHEHSWRDVLKQQGHDPDSLKQQLVAVAVTALRGADRSADERGDGGSTGADRK